MALLLFALVLFLFGLVSIIYEKPFLSQTFTYLVSCFAIALFLEPISVHQGVKWIPTWVLGMFIITFALNVLVKSRLIKTFFVGTLPVFFLVQGETLSFGEYTLNSSSFSFIGLVLLGFIVPKVLFATAYLLNRWMSTDEAKTAQIIWPFAVGILFFIGFFYHSFSGLLAIVVGLFLFVVSDEIKIAQLLNSLIFLSAAIGFFGMSYLSSNTLISGNIFLGVGLAASGFSLLKHYKGIASKNLMRTLVIVTLGCCSLLLPLYLGGKNISFGGQGVFIVALIVLGFLSNHTSKNEWHETLIRVFYTLSMGCALLIFSFQNENYKKQGFHANFGSFSEKNEIMAAFQNVKSSPFQAISGNYSIAQENFEFNFELGPKGERTKGAFQEISGEIHIDTTLTNSSFTINLPVKGLTTFEPSRDEALMADDYFNLSKFPSITFKSTAIKETKEGITVKGNFTMLGVSKETTVSIKYTDDKNINGKKFPVLKGAGSLDRTHFGMEPDPSIGNLVDYKFTLLLKKF